MHAALWRALVVCVAAIVCASCDRPGGATRPLRVRGIPVCSKGVRYARPLVVRIDRDRALFEEEYSMQKTIESPPPTRDTTLDVARMRMKATVRVGICAETSLATWDCNAASWVGVSTIALDAKANEAEVTIEAKEVPCADGAIAK